MIATATPSRLSPRQLALVRAAAPLFAQRGYHNVSMAEIAAQLRLTGPAVYRHFACKQALLVAVLDDCIRTLLDEVRAVLATDPDPAAALTALVEGHADFVFLHTGNITTWRTELTSLPAPDRSRLRRQQRAYTEEWVHLVRRLRPELDADGARALCHAVIAVLQSPTEFHSDLPVAAHQRLLRELALTALLGTAPPPSPEPVPAPELVLTLE